MDIHLPRAKVKKYLSEHIGEGKYSVHKMYAMYMKLMNVDEIITTYKPMSEASLQALLVKWSCEKDGFLTREGCGLDSIYSKRIEPIPDSSYYLSGLSFTDNCKFSKHYKKINKILCDLLRKEHR